MDSRYIIIAGDYQAAIAKETAVDERDEVYTPAIQPPNGVRGQRTTREYAALVLYRARILACERDNTPSTSVTTGDATSITNIAEPYITAEDIIAADDELRDEFTKEVTITIQMNRIKDNIRELDADTPGME